MSYAVYDTTGKIRVVIDCPESHMPHQLDVGENYVEGENIDGRNDYVLNGTITLRPNSVCTVSATTVSANAVTAVTLTTTAGAEVSVTGPFESNFISASSDDITFSVPGEYTITVEEPFPAKPAKVTIHAA